MEDDFCRRGQHRWAERKVALRYASHQVLLASEVHEHLCLERDINMYREDQVRLELFDHRHDVCKTQRLLVAGLHWSLAEAEPDYRAPPMSVSKRKR
jgi:hypothetical protein